MIWKTQIIEITCSQSLKDEIQRRQFELFDRDLIILAYNHAPDYCERLRLLQLVFDNCGDAKVRDWARRCLEFERNKLKAFESDMPDAVYETIIKTCPNSCEEHNLAKTLEGAKKNIRMFFAHYEEKEKEDTCYQIVKRRVRDIESPDDFDEDWLGKCCYKTGFVLDSVYARGYDDEEYDLDDAAERLIDNAKSDEADYGVDCRYSLIFAQPMRLPRFLNNLDLVTFIDGAFERRYALVLENKKDIIEDDNCAHCIRILKNRITGKPIKTAEVFWKLCSNLHEHNPYPTLEKIKLKNTPEWVKKEYRAFVRYYKKFYNSEHEPSPGEQLLQE